MAELTDFLNERASSLSDFVQDVSTNPVYNRPSARNVAAHSALMSDSPVETYDRVMAEMEMFGQSGEAGFYTNEFKAYMAGGMRDQLTQTMADPLISVEEKQAALQGYQAAVSKPTTLAETLMTRGIIEPVSDETPSEENYRVNTGLIIEQVNQTRSEIQNLLNEAIAETDPGILSTVSDLAEMVLPFAWNRPLKNVKAEIEGGSLANTAEAFVLSGEGRQELAGYISQLPDHQRLEFARRVIEIGNNHSGMVWSNENKIEKITLLQTALDQGSYENTDRFVDNLMSVLETTGLGYVVAKYIGIARNARRIYSATKAAAIRDAVRSPVAPESASQGLKEANPEKYRNLHMVMRADETEETAMAAYGASRLDSIGHDIAREVLKPFDTVKHKVEIPDVPAEKALMANPRLVDKASRNGALYLTDAELENAGARVINRFKEVNGVVPRTAMFREGNVVDGVEGTAVDDIVVIRAVYGPRDGGWVPGPVAPESAVQDAVDTLTLNLREFGVVEDEVEVLVRRGEFYEPRKIDEVDPGEQDFLLQVKYDYKLQTGDIDYSPLDVKRNFLARIAPSFAYGQRFIFDPASMLNPRNVLPANVAVDEAAGLSRDLLNLGKEFTDIWKKLPTERQIALHHEIKRANFEGLAVDKVRMRADGATDLEINAMEKWRTYWDTVYVLENRDLIRTLTNRGYQAVENKASKTKLYARPVHQTKAGGAQRAYDVDSGEMVSLTKEEVELLYEKGGHLSQARSKMTVNGEVVGGDDGLAVIVRNQPGGTTSRAIRPTEEVLNYRQGYYSIKYEAPYFIVKTEVGADGKEYERAVGVAGSLKEANLYARNAGKDGGSYRVRSDVKAGTGEYEDFEWQVNSAAGRSAQRVRGERLEDATSTTFGADNQYVMDPVDSLIASAKSIANRIAMREYMDNAKARFLTQYEELLTKNRYGEPLWPSKISQIGREGEFPSATLADARTTWEYLHYLENGYINSIDEGVKSVMRAFAYAAGEKGWTKAEKALYAIGDSRGPTAMAKNVAFNLYLVLNPVRQAVVQAHQAVQLSAIAPKYVGTRLAPDLTLLASARLGGGKVDKNLARSFGRSKQEVEDMYKAYEESGLSAAIDRQNLVRGSLASFADDLTYKGAAQGGAAKGLRAAGHVLNASRRAGFDFGEEVNMMTAWLTFYNRKLEQVGGARPLTQRDYDEVRALARDYTYNMNMAGDMPYNQNFLAAAFQFFQVPHKAVLQMTFNRNLTLREKSRLAAFNAVMYGVPAGSLLYYQLEKQLPPEGEFRELALQGLEGYFFNKVLEATTGEEVRSSYDGLAAADISHMVEFIGNFIEDPILGTLTNSPSGQLLFGHNPRLTEFMKTLGKVTGVIERDSPFTERDLNIIKETFALSSGFSNAFKARAAYKLGYHVNAQGVVIDENVSWPEAVNMFFGFETIDAKNRRYLLTKNYEELQSFEEDVKATYTAMRKEMAKIDASPSSMEDSVRAMQFLMHQWEDSPKARSMLRGMFMRDVRENNDARFFRTMIRNMGQGVLDKKFVEHAIRSAPNSVGKEEALETLRLIDQLQELKVE